MRYLVVLLLAGCASRDFGVENYEGSCARQCLQMNTACHAARPAGFTAVCDDNTRQCLTTCPAK